MKSLQGWLRASLIALALALAACGSGSGTSSEALAVDCSQIDGAADGCDSRDLRSPPTIDEDGRPRAGEADEVFVDEGEDTQGGLLQGGLLSAARIRPLELVSGATSDFGPTKIRTRVVNDYVFTNLSGTAKEVYAHWEQGASASKMSIPDSGNFCGRKGAPVTVQPRGTCRVQVDFSPIQTGYDSGTITIFSAGQWLGFDRVFGYGTPGGGGWSRALEPATPLIKADLAFAPTLVGATDASKTIYVFSPSWPGDYKDFELGFELYGRHAKHFELEIHKTGWDRGQSLGLLPCGVTYLTPQETSSPCKADSSPYGANRISVTVKYRPLSPGEHYVELAPLVDRFARRDPLPPSLYFTGNAVLDLGAQWSSHFESVVQPSTAFEAGKAGGSYGMLLVVHNFHATKSLSLGFRLEGTDAEHFTIEDVRRMDGYHGGSLDCAMTFDEAKHSTGDSYCLAWPPGESFDKVLLHLQYKPKTTGVHTVRLVPTTNNGTLLPGVLTLTGTAF